MSHTLETNGTNIKAVQKNFERCGRKGAGKGLSNPELAALLATLAKTIK